MPADKSSKTTKKAGKGRSAARPGRGAKTKAAAAAKEGASPGAAVPKRKKPAGSAAAGAKRDAAARAAALKALVIAALEDMKALEIRVLDVRGLTDVADTMVIASGTSDRHVRSVAQRLVEKTKAGGFRPHGVEGQQDSDWVLIDLDDIIVHVMLPRVREFYGLEKLWDITTTRRAARA